MSASDPADGAGAAVRVAWCRTARLGQGCVEEALRLLSADERERLERLALPADRRDFAVAHALLRVAIAEEVGVAPARLRFGADRYGKPFVVPCSGAGRPPQFSLSRRRGVVAIARAARGYVGVDVERVDRSLDVLALARQAFPPAEAQALQRVPEPERAVRFAELWTLREALFKAVGFGLAAPPGSAAFAIGTECIQVTSTPPIPEEAWTCAVHHLGDAYTLAVVAGGTGAFRPPLVVTEVGAAFNLTSARS